MSAFSLVWLTRPSNLSLICSLFSNRRDVVIASTEKDEDEGRGWRVKAPVVYKEGLTDEQFFQVSPASSVLLRFEKLTHSIPFSFLRQQLEVDSDDPFTPQSTKLSKSKNTSQIDQDSNTKKRGRPSVSATPTPSLPDEDGRDSVSFPSLLVSDGRSNPSYSLTLPTILFSRSVERVRRRSNDCRFVHFFGSSSLLCLRVLMNAFFILPLRPVSCPFTKGSSLFETKIRISLTRLSSKPPSRRRFVRLSFPPFTLRVDQGSLTSLSLRTFRLTRPTISSSRNPSG